MSTFIFFPRGPDPDTAQIGLTSKTGLLKYGMTEINKPVRRRTRGTYSVLYCNARKARKIIVEVAPADVLVFRESGRRIRFTLAIDDAFTYAVRMAGHAKAKRRTRV